MRRLAIVLLAAFAGVSHAAIVDVAPGDPSIRYLGRYGSDSYSKDIQWSWSGSGASITFAGTSCAIRMQAQGAMYSVLVDGKETKALDLSNASNDTLFSLATGLSQGTHTVAVRLRSEAQYSLTHFRGFRIDGTPGTAAVGSDRRVEFYGNSITCGYGILDSVASHSFKVQTEDEALTYAALAADSMGAERHTICWSGRGVIQNYGGDTKSPTVPQMVQQVLTSDTTVPWNFSLWVPQVVVIDLGTNDYSTASAQPDSTKFYRTYLAFVDTLHARYPKAKFVLLDGPMMSDNYPAGLNTATKLKNHLDNIVTAATKQGIEVTHLSLAPQSDAIGYGADYHPNQVQARLNAKELTAHLRAVTGWGPTSNQGRPGTPRKAEILRSKNGLSVRTPAGTSFRAKILDMGGRTSWRHALAAGSTTALPRMATTRWLVLESASGTQILPLQPGLL